MINVKSETIM